MCLYFVITLNGQIGLRVEKQKAKQPKDLSLLLAIGFKTIKPLNH